MAVISSIIAAIAGVVANIGSSACGIFLIDEPECPKSLLK